MIIVYEAITGDSGTEPEYIAHNSVSATDEQPVEIAMYFTRISMHK